ncbi:MAG: MBL fold metallo-hydrolase [Deltaproteobacteria bacterium]
MKWLRRLGVLALLFVLLGFGGYLLARPAMGHDPSGADLERISKSPQYKGERFDNELPRVDGPYWDMTTEWFSGGSDYRLPGAPLKVERRTKADFATPPASGMRVTWLGHSTLILEIDGRRILIDPVWGPRASPLTFIGPERWYDPPLPIEELPTIDAILISHDHYDHLDYPTVQRLADLDTKWLVPLGIGSHLEGWGVKRERIVELDWWGAQKIGDLEITCAPARHFSGRGFTPNATLWSGWAVAGPKHRVFYSGDTAMHPEFIEIGERLGPFDLAMMEVGAYDAMWSDVHLGPEQAVRATRLVRADTLLPVHWGLFDLALHGWTEPIERVRVAGDREGVRVVSPQPGGQVEPTRTSTPTAKWWPDVPWESFEDAPCPSTSVDDLNGEKYAPGTWPRHT